MNPKHAKTRLVSLNMIPRLSRAMPHTWLPARLRLPGLFVNAPAKRWPWPRQGHVCGRRALIHV